jgi:signal transduction histidine kinase
MSQNELISRSHDVLPGHGTHLVQFYEEEAFLFDVVGTFIADGLMSGEPVVVIATEEHRRGFTASLAARGLDAGGVVFLDAADTMAQFMDGALPDEQRFMTAIGGVLEQALASSPKTRIRAYGEMVDLLWREGNPEGAIRLEELWNDIGALYSFTLLCAYPMGNFYKESDGSLFEEVCHTHGRVFPAESYDRAGDDDARLREVAALQQRAAALEAEVRHRRAVERALRDALRENARLYELAQETNRTKDEFLATLSHELRTPLTAILGWARMLTLGSMDDKTTRTAIETIERSARTQASLIDDLLDLSRIVTGKLTLRSEPVDLGAVVDNAVQTVRLAADVRGIRIDVRESRQRCIVTGDATRLQQIVWNLLANAVKFSVAGGEVSVGIERNGGENARLVVSDRGRGISAAFLPHIFEPFRQADGASTRSYNGLGLGLAIVKYLVELHGGTVGAVSEGEGNGATFTVSLPLAARTLRPELPRKTGDDVADLTGTTIFVVDDADDARDVIAAILRRCGANVETFESVDGACMRLHEGRPNMIVTDIAMPGQDGYALMKKLRAGAATADLPVVALTAVADALSEERLREAGFKAYLRKPVDPVELSRIVADARDA